MILKAFSGMVSWLLASQPVKALSGILAAATLRPMPNRKPTVSEPKPNRIPSKQPLCSPVHLRVTAIAQHIAEMMPTDWHCTVTRTLWMRLTMVRLRIWSPSGQEWGYEYAVSDVATGKEQVWSLVERKMDNVAAEIIQNEELNLQDGPIQNPSHQTEYPIIATMTSCSFLSNR